MRISSSLVFVFKLLQFFVSSFLLGLFLFYTEAIIYRSIFTAFYSLCDILYKKMRQNVLLSHSPISPWDTLMSMCMKLFWLLITSCCLINFHNSLVIGNSFPDVSKGLQRAQIHSCMSKIVQITFSANLLVCKDKP